MGISWSGIARSAGSCCSDCIFSLEITTSACGLLVMTPFPLPDAGIAKEQRDCGNLVVRHRPQCRLLLQ